MQFASTDLYLLSFSNIHSGFSEEMVARQPFIHLCRLIMPNYVACARTAPSMTTNIHGNIPGFSKGFASEVRAR
jgi:hypothetical protein